MNQNEYMQRSVRKRKKYQFEENGRKLSSLTYLKYLEAWNSNRQLSGVLFYITLIIKETGLFVFVILKNSFLDMIEIDFKLQTIFTEQNP